MPYFNRNWSLDTMEDQLDYLAESVQADPETAHLGAPIADTRVLLTEFLAERKRLKKEQRTFSCRLAAADRRLDVRTSGLSAAARQLERVNPTLKILGVLFPEGVTAVTRYRGRGVVTELRAVRGVLEVIEGMPEAEPLRATAADVRTAVSETEDLLRQLLAVDEQIENRRPRAEELAERAYQIYYATRNELLKIYHNDKRLVDTFFLD